MWTYIFCALSVAISGYALAKAFYAVQIADQRQEFPRAAIRSIESKLQSLEDSQKQTEETLQILANRFKMQRVRNAINHVPDREPELNGATLKDMLRKKAGLVAGQPAKHA